MRTKPDRKEAEQSDRVGVLWDGTWAPGRATLYLHPSIPKDIFFRHILYRDPETKKTFDFITSDNESSAQSIADIYKKRWAVELLFRWLKGHLNIRYFSVRNPNALRTQLAIAVLIQLLVQLHRIKNKLNKTLWECLRQIRVEMIKSGLQSYDRTLTLHGEGLTL